MSPFADLWIRCYTPQVVMEGDGFLAPLPSAKCLWKWHRGSWSCPRGTQSSHRGNALFGNLYSLPTSKRSWAPRVVTSEYSTASKLKSEDVFNGLIWKLFKDALGNKQMERIGLGRHLALKKKKQKTTCTLNKSPLRSPSKSGVRSSFFPRANLSQQYRVLFWGFQ